MSVPVLFSLVSSLIAAPPAMPVVKAAPPPRAPTPGLISTRALCVPTPGEQRLDLRFEGSRLEDLVRDVARHTCRNLVLSPRDADARIGVYFGAGVTAERLWPTFLEILAAHDLTVVDGPSATVIITSSDGARSALPTLGATDETPAEARMVTKVLRPKTKDLNALGNFLNLYKSGRGQIQPYTPTGVLVISDYAPVVRRLERLIAQLE